MASLGEVQTHADLAADAIEGDPLDVLQVDAPLENIVAMYKTAAEYRGIQS